MNVLSLFDGMSCGQIALRDLGFKIDRYYASEIDKHAIAQTKLNFPNTSFLGDVREVDVSKLEPIDLLIGGSPCQSFSFAGKMNGMSTTTNKEVCRSNNTFNSRRMDLNSKGSLTCFGSTYASCATFRSTTRMYSSCSKM